MPIAIILTIMPAALLGTVMVLMTPGESRATTIAMGVAVALTGILFVGIIASMRRQHPSQAGGDSHLPQDRSPDPDADDADDADDAFDDAVTPVAWPADTRTTADDRPELGRWTDDGAPPIGR